MYRKKGAGLVIGWVSVGIHPVGSPTHNENTLINTQYRNTFRLS